MATPQEKLAEALEALRVRQAKGQIAIKSSGLARDHRERLLKAGFIKRVMKGWYIPSRPEETGAAETTAWYASFWAFCAAYLKDRFGEEWSLSPEQSVLIHAGSRVVPNQLMIRAPGARNNITNLAHGTSILEVRARIARGSVLELVDDLQVFKLPYALINSTEKFFKSHATDARAALARIKDASELLSILLQGGHSTVAGRLAGALRTIDRGRMADDIIKAMRVAGYTVAETNPFEDDINISLPIREPSPYVSRINTNWHTMREGIIAAFPEPAGIPGDKAAYLKEVDEIYVTDAYHSLSIEGYRVTPDLIERVRSGDWNPDQLEADRQRRDAMAARGYWLAFNEVKKSVEKVFDGENAGDVAEHDHGDWYRALFSPSVDANILEAADLAGYRNDQVFIRNSKHVPPKKEAILDCMPALFDHLREETHPAVRIVLGHWVFVYIHPYMDGNGRMGRFLMNAMLASGGYPWTVVPVDRRSEYMAALEAASVKDDIIPFTKFLAGLVGK
jgi:hypothetical protein